MSGLNGSNRCCRRWPRSKKYRETQRRHLGLSGQRSSGNQLSYINIFAFPRTHANDGQNPMGHAAAAAAAAWMAHMMMRTFDQTSGYSRRPQRFNPPIQPAWTHTAAGPGVSFDIVHLHLRGPGPGRFFSVHLRKLIHGWWHMANTHGIRDQTQARTTTMQIANSNYDHRLACTFCI